MEALAKTTSVTPTEQTLADTQRPWRLAEKTSTGPSRKAISVTLDSTEFHTALPHISAFRISLTSILLIGRAQVTCQHPSCKGDWRSEFLTSTWAGRTHNVENPKHKIVF